MAASPSALIPFLAFQCLALRPADFVDRNDRQNCKGRESNCHVGAPAQPSRALYSRGECFPRLNTNHRSRSLSSDWPKQRAGWFLSLQRQPAVLRTSFAIRSACRSTISNWSIAALFLTTAFTN